MTRPVVYEPVYPFAFPPHGHHRIFALSSLEVIPCPRLLVPSVLYACAPYHFVRSMGAVVWPGDVSVPAFDDAYLVAHLHEPFPVHPHRPRHGSARLVFLPLGVGGGLACLCPRRHRRRLLRILLLFPAARGRHQGSFADGQWRSLISAGVLIAVIASTVVAALAPNFHYRLVHGPNLETAVRDPVEADIYGLNVAEMLLPISGHRVSRMVKIYNSYMVHRHTTGEFRAVPLGVVTSLGFLWLVGRFLWRRPALWIVSTTPWLT